jgi:NADH-quinone oxidoreductase subunit E
MVTQITPKQSSSVKDSNPGKKIKLSDEAEKRVEEIKLLYPQAKSAIMPALYIAQQHFGFINQDAVLWVAQKIGVPPVQVMEVATFYTMYYKKKPGKYHIQVCRTLSCAVVGSRKITEFVKNRLGVKAGEVSDDGLWSFEEVECLGSCGTGPMCQINDRFFENLDTEKMELLMQRIEKDLPSLRYSTVKDDIEGGLSEIGYSQVHIQKS